MKGFKEMWKARSAAKVTAEEAFKNIDDVSRIGTRLGEDIAQYAESAARSLGTVKSKLSSISSMFPEQAAPVRTMIQQLESAEALLKTKPDDAAKIIDSVLAEINRTDVDALVKELMTSGKITSEFQAMALRNQIISGMGDITSALGSSKSYAARASQLVKEIGATRAGGSDVDFANQYLKFFKRRDTPEAQRWFANPYNRDRLDKLRQSGRASKILDELEGSATRLPLSVRLKGLTYTDVLKRMGLGAGAAGVAATGVANVFNWFDNSTDVVGDQTQELGATLINLQNSTSGKGHDIIVMVIKAIKNMGNESQKAQTMMDGNTPGAIETYAKAMASQHAVLTGALNQWDTVVGSISGPNKQMANQARGQLEAFAELVANQLTQLGANVGIQAQKPTDTFNEGANISQIQELLKVPITGELDQPTVTALKLLENKLNLEAGSDEFTGYFYNPASNYVISYQDLLNAKRRLEKY